MNNTNTGGPAFPLAGAVFKGTNGQGMGIEASLGMTLRDYFAAKAMTGLLANNDLGWGIDEYVRYAYKVADSMLKARQS
jgi:hypothetical protein